jgi:hypothetical protein
VLLQHTSGVHGNGAASRPSWEGVLDRRVPQGGLRGLYTGLAYSQAAPLSGPPRPLCSSPPPSIELLSVLCSAPGFSARGTPFILREGALRMPRNIYCKPYHKPKTGRAEAQRRTPDDLKSTCPGWARSVERRLLDEALVDEEAGTDVHGHPRKLWNAVNGEVFVGVSTNLAEPTYNCYPAPPTSETLRKQLEERRRLSLDAFERERGDS